MLDCTTHITLQLHLHDYDLSMVVLSPAAQAVASFQTAHSFDALAEASENERQAIHALLHSEIMLSFRMHLGSSSVVLQQSMANWDHNAVGWSGCLLSSLK